MNFFEHQQQARNQTKRLVVFFIAAIIAIVFLVNLAVFFGSCVSNIYCTDFKSYWLQPVSWMVTGGTILVIVMTSLIRWSQLKSGGGYKTIAMVGARPVNMHTQDAKERQLINVVEEMSIAAGIPMPSIFIMEQELAINAFVAGTEPHNTCLAVTKGCLEKLNRQELQGVIGHEYSHIFNGDMRLNIYLIGILALNAFVRCIRRGLVRVVNRGVRHIEEERLVFVTLDEVDAAICDDVRRIAG